eukprot:TRINITY_DN5072_c3_g1_i1.p1 TRINITY_DN5072_c3_g1~~TRINITY_DN5072_c3_g1_i1.p1  ORF type:complete len:1098 (-),score=291.53 TRINITY_DN5072_c3_g1_i1:177-3470(-)
MRVWHYGDNINTDQLFPGKYTYTCATAEEIKPHLLEDLDSEFAANVQRGDVLFVGENFGCGSSREQPALGLAAVGIAAVVGKSFARIFYRAAINQGLILLECGDAVNAFSPGDKVDLRLEEGVVKVAGKEFHFPKLPPQILAIRDAGGLLQYTMERLKKSSKDRAGESATCGHAGPTVKSDCKVTVSLTGDTTDEVTSTDDLGLSVEDIRHWIHEFREHFGLKKGRIIVEDCGAPAWVICARLEIAYTSLRAHAVETPFLPVFRKEVPPKASFVPPRSRLYVPGHSPRFLVKIPECGADMVTIDLEDAVPLLQKQEARILTRNALRAMDFGQVQTSVRINSLNSSEGEHDVLTVVPSAGAYLHAIVLSKCEDGPTVSNLVDMIRSNLPDDCAMPRVMPVLESALGVENAFQIGKAVNPRFLAGLAMGLEDYTADIGVVKSTEGTESLWACSRVINAAAASGTVAYDSVYANFRDLEGLSLATQKAKKMGFAGKSCIHPSQVVIINEVFSPSEEEIAKARAIVDTYEKGGKGAVSMDGSMIDAPVVKRALRILSMVERAPALNPEKDAKGDPKKIVKKYLNAAGRLIPEYVPGYGKTKRFEGAFANPPEEGKVAKMALRMFKPGDSKMCADIREALLKCGIKDGMTISFHHHLREGDAVVGMCMDVIKDLGIKDLTLAPSALFSVHNALLPLIHDGTVRNVEGSMNGPIGKMASLGGMKDTCVLRSHGGRVRAIYQGDLSIDIAVIAAPTADEYGNATGVIGKSACGPLAYSHADSLFAKKVIVVTDNLVQHPCSPIAISQANVDHVVVVDSIGDASKIVSGTTKIALGDPVSETIARHAANATCLSGLLKDGCTLQAGAGGVSLASMKFIADVMEEKGIVGSWVNGGTTSLCVDMYKRGLVKKIITVQAFDIPAVLSMAEDYPDHVEINVDCYANIYNASCLVNALDVVVLGATEVDVDFNVNVNTHSDGLLLHGIGGHQDTAAGAKLTIITCPTARKTNPIILDRVTSITTPGECVDIIATEEGIAVNPRRKDLLEALKNYDGLKTIHELQEIGEKKAGRKMVAPKVRDNIIAVIEWRDGSVIDVVYEVDAEEKKE